MSKLISHAVLMFYFIKALPDIIDLYARCSGVWNVQVGGPEDLIQVPGAHEEYMRIKQKVLNEATEMLQLLGMEWRKSV